MMEGFIFSPAVREDIPEIVRLYQSLYGAPGCTWDPDYPNRETAESDAGSGTLYVLKKDGMIVAAASAGAFDELGHLRWASRNPCELARIGVLPAMQNRGAGTALLLEIIETMRGKGFDGIRLLASPTNPAALALYKKNGFVNRGETRMYDIDFYCYELLFGGDARSGGEPTGT